MLCIAARLVVSALLAFAVHKTPLRSTRQGIKAARFVTKKCREREVFLVDPFELRLPLLDKMYKEYPPGGAPEALERLAERVKAADAY
ncbi:MAG: NADPH-dependent FMN reductase, partial [Gammaproteobacteria bacterium]